DFKRTVISTGSEVIVVGGERRKREIKLPERYRDAADDLCTVNAAHSDNDSITGEAPGIPPSEYRKHIKRCSLTVPWYDVGGISIWCMEHSCYDCLCLIHPDAFQ
ncbi:unnamed protein product, partial [Meganyctiphanes norvegica]